MAAKHGKPVQVPKATVKQIEMLGPGGNKTKPKENEDIEGLSYEEEAKTKWRIASHYAKGTAVLILIKAEKAMKGRVRTATSRCGRCKRKIIGMEALLRWYGYDLGMVCPDHSYL